jgi:drug/metabolite transporter (DMT)-like permease
MHRGADTEIVGRDVLATVIAAVGAAFLYALSNVYQQEEAEQFTTDDTIKLSLLAKLAKRPRWWIGMGSDVGGFVFEAVALGIGSLMLVEPILSTSLLLSLLLSSWLQHRRVERSGWIAAVVLAVGVSCFLYQVSPTGGDQVASIHDWIVMGLPVTAVALFCVGRARVATGSRRAALLGIAAGAAFGVSAVLTKAFVHYLADGVFGWVNHWEPYALAVFAIGGLVCSQSAFQTGALPAAVAAEQVMQPLVGVMLGAGLLGEQTSANGLIGFVALLAAIGAMGFGVVGVARAEYSEDTPEDVQGWSTRDAR